MIGYVIAGPLVALLVSLKFTDNRFKKHEQGYEALVSKIELLDNRNEVMDKEMLQKIMTTVMPIAKAVNKLNQEVGL